MNAHRLAKYFPILEGEEFDLLVSDIEKNGQIEPIVTVDGKILDGMNRYRACERLGLKPKMIEFTGTDPLSHVISLNIRRRHLDTSQRAMLATEMLPELERKRADSTESVDSAPTDLEGYKRSTTEAGKLFNVSQASVIRAKRVKKDAPEKVDAIIKGKETVRAVDSELRKTKAEETARERKGKEEEKKVKEHPKVVKEYLEATKHFKEELNLAIASAKRGLFSPESINIIETKHNQINDLMSELEESI